MGFTSALFIFGFFPVSVAGFFLVDFLESKFEKIRNSQIKKFFLFLVSIFFYSFFNLRNLCWILIFISVTYLSGRFISRFNSKKKLILVLSVISFVMMLFYFKYFAFVTETVGMIFSTTFDIGKIIAPLGISFILFSSVSYIVDIYRNDAECGSFLDTAVFLTFFPKVISGPIVLWKEFLPQINCAKPSGDLFIRGINRISIGFAKKVIIADTLGMLVRDAIDNLAVGIDTPSAWILVLFYYFQIYFDFSGYSDISIGISSIFGFDIKNNFNFPYISTSITEFWRRWHISLGSWFKEYLYIPLGGNRKSKLRTLFNIFVVFLVTGIWHGAGLTYILWGLLHGTCRIFEKCVENTKFYKRIPGFIKWLVTTFVVMVGWLAFCFEDMGQLLEFSKVLFAVVTPQKVGLTYEYFCNLRAIVVTVIALIGSLLLSCKCFEKLYTKLMSKPITFALLQSGVLLIFVLSLIFMINSTYSPFIYFQY